MVVVKDIARLRALLALYLSPPFGTLSYLLLYGSSPRRGALAVLAGLMVLKLAAAAICAVVCGASAWAATIRWGTVPQAVIEKHLRANPSTNAEREQYLKNAFETGGCAGNLVEQAVKHSTSPNLICTLPGS